MQVAKILLRNAAGQRCCLGWGRRAISLVLMLLLLATILAPIPLPRLWMSAPAPIDASDLGGHPAEEGEAAPEIVAMVRRTLRQSAESPCESRRDWTSALPPRNSGRRTGATECGDARPDLFGLGARLRC